MFTFESPMVDLLCLPLESEVTGLQCLPLKVHWWIYYIYLSRVDAVHTFESQMTDLLCLHFGE